MKVTKELREYISNKVNVLIPEPISKADADEVLAEVNRTREEFSIYMNAMAESFIAEVKKNPKLEGCDISNNIHKHSLNISAAQSKVLQQFHKDYEDCIQFRNSAAQKIIALLSVQKEVSDLDNFIISVISTIK